MRRLLAWVLVGVLAAAVLGACGGDGDGADDDVQAADLAGADSDEEGDGGDGGDSDGDSSSGDDDGGSGGVVPTGVFSAQRCVEAIQAYSAGAAASAMAMSGETKAMKESIAQMEKFADEAPREIRDDLQRISEAWTTYVTAIADAGWDPQAGRPPTEAQAEKLSDAAKVFEEEDYMSAQSNLDDWFASDCSSR